MSPRWLQFSVCYCLRRRHGDPTTKICYIQGEKLLEVLSKQDGRRESYFVSCHSDETVYALLEPKPARSSNCCHINTVQFKIVRRIDRKLTIQIPYLLLPT